MKITAQFHGLLQNKKIILLNNDPKDFINIEKLFTSKESRELRRGEEILLTCTIDAPYQKKSFKQRAAIFKLVEVIFISENDRKCTNDEKYELYIDLLELYADKIPNRYNNQLRSIHVSESNTIAAAHFITGLLYHLSTMCNLTMDLESDVRSVLYDWEIWRGNQEHDFSDDITPEELRQRIRFSEASGQGGAVDLHHIVSRGANPAAIEKAWNLIALTREEHDFYHLKGEKAFLDRFPHLINRFRRAQKLAAEMDKKNSQLAYMAMEV